MIIGPNLNQRGQPIGPEMANLDRKINGVQRQLTQLMVQNRGSYPRTQRFEQRRGPRPPRPVVSMPPRSYAPPRPRPPRSPPRFTDSRACYECGAANHFARECRVRRARYAAEGRRPDGYPPISVAKN
jgi:hypothetical protein